MIKQVFVISLLVIPTQATASTSCPTCPKMYPRIEELLITEQKTKAAALKNLPQESSLLHAKTRESAQKKSPGENIVNQMNTKNSQVNVTTYGLQSRAPKRDKVLEVADAPSRQLRAPNSSPFQDQGNQNLRENFDRNMAMATQLQNRKR